MITIGAVAPDFTLPGTDGTEAGRRDYSLSDYAGQPVVLAFYPADHSPVCTIQLNAYTDDIKQFDDVGAQVLALSPQSVAEHDDFAETNGGFAFPLLADLEKTVATSYGTLGPLGFYRRSVFVVDARGLVRYAHRSTAGLTFRPVDELIHAVKAAS
jgi:peroxiredoxin Q/BCP